MPDRTAGTLTLVLLLADAWLLTSRDGVTWTETHVHGSFDMAVATVARGRFLGDDQGLVSAADLVQGAAR